MNENIPSWFDDQAAAPVESVSTIQAPVAEVRARKPHRWLTWVSWFLTATFFAYAVFATVQWRHYQSNYDDYILKGSQEYAAAEDDEAPLVDKSSITAAGLLDSLDQKADMVLYVCQMNQTSCDQSTDFVNKSKISDTAKSIFSTFDTSVGLTGDTDERADLTKVTEELSLSSQQPSLLYIKQGQVVDRLTDLTQESIGEFLTSH